VLLVLVLEIVSEFPPEFRPSIVRKSAPFKSTEAPPGSPRSSARPGAGRLDV
jgi:hypothetical protein